MDKKSLEIKEKFVNNVLKEKDLLKRKFNYLQIKKDFNNYLLSVREERLKRNYPCRIDQFDIFCVHYDQLSDFYDLETGYKLETGTRII